MRAHLPITLERFAQLQARVDEGERLDQLLAREGLAEDSWRASQRGWLALIGAESAKRHHELAQRYQRAYLEARPDLVAAPRIEPAAGPAPGDVDSTAMVVTIDAGEALPFMAPAASPAPEVAPAPVTPAAEPEPVAEEDSGRTAAAVAAERGVTDETAFVSVLSDADVLPFVQQAPAEPAPAAVAPAAPAPATPAPVPVPAPPASAAAPAQLSLEQYASLCAERARTPHAITDIERRYGLAPGAAASQDASWARRFDSDPSLRARFASLLEHYASWLRQQGGGG